MRRSPTVLIACLLAAACTDAAAPERADPRIAQLARDVETLRASNEALGKEVRRQARMLDGLGRDVMTLTGGRRAPGPERSGPRGDLDAEGPGAGVAAAREPGDPAEEDVGAATGEQAVDTLLASEQGRKAIEAAAARELEKREEQERRVFVSYTVGVFARKAGLDDHQTDELQRIWKESLDSGVELRKEFAALRELPEDERPEARARAMETMRALGRRRTESVRDLLSAEQLTLYEKTEDEIVAGLHGGPRQAPKAQ